MIKFIGEMAAGSSLVGLGLSSGNLMRLLAGEPLFLSDPEFQIPEGAAVLIFYAPTDDALAEALKAMGDLSEAEIRFHSSPQENPP